MVSAPPLPTVKDGGNMRDAIGKIKCPFKRRVALCAVVVPAVVVHIVEELITIMDDAVTTFKDVWKGV